MNQANTSPNFPLSVGMVLYEGFELLDVFGPLEMFGMLPDYFSLTMLAEHEGLVCSTQGPKTAVDQTFAEAKQVDILIVPGGRGSLTEINNTVLLEFLQKQANKASFVASVCTGSSLLAKAGLLDGRRATSNKLYFERMKPSGPKVDWVAKARWIEDGKFFTSSGVSAGMDMSLALIAQIVGKDLAQQAAIGAEYTWQQDAEHDPFASLHGLD